MLRKFNISIDGKKYLVEMEEIGAVAQTPASPVAVAPVQVAPAVSEVPPVRKPTPTAAEDAMTAPMPGTILKIAVKPGDQVEESQVLLVLEAMKMENEIVANKAGVVKGIFVNNNDTVNAGDPLITIQ
jgi:biotin carboxyl carrier protein